MWGFHGHKIIVCSVSSW